MNSNRKGGWKRCAVEDERATHSVKFRGFIDCDDVHSDRWLRGYYAQRTWKRFRSTQWKPRLSA